MPLGATSLYFIERLTDQDKLVRHLYVELDQATKHIRATIEEGSDTVKECFVVVQRGLNIGFFEFHLRQENLKEKDISNFRDCVFFIQVLRTDEHMLYIDEDLMLIQNYDSMNKIDQSLKQLINFDDEYRRVIVSTTLEDLKQLSFDNYSDKDTELLRIRNDVRLYISFCVLNVQQHQVLIDYLFHYMSLQTSSVTNIPFVPM